MWIYLCQKCTKCVNSTQKKLKKISGEGQAPSSDLHCGGESNISWKGEQNWLRNYEYSWVKSARKCVNCTHKNSKNFLGGAQPPPKLPLRRKRIFLGKEHRMATEFYWSGFCLSLWPDLCVFTRATHSIAQSLLRQRVRPSVTPGIVSKRLNLS